MDGGEDFRSPRGNGSERILPSVIGVAFPWLGLRPVPSVGASDRGYHGEDMDGSVVLGRLLLRVAMMQATQARTGNHGCPRRQLLMHCPTIRGILAEAVVNSIFVKVGNVLPDAARQVCIVQRDHVVQYLAPTATHPSFGNSILPGRSDTRPFGFQTGGFQELDDIRVEPRVAVQNRVTVGASVGKALPQLLDDPLRRRVSGHVEVQDPAASVR